MKRLKFVVGFLPFVVRVGCARLRVGLANRLMPGSSDAVALVAELSTLLPAALEAAASYWKGRYEALELEMLYASRLPQGPPHPDSLRVALDEIRWLAFTSESKEEG